MEVEPVLRWWSGWEIDWAELMRLFSFLFFSFRREVCLIPPTPIYYPDLFSVLLLE